MNDEHILAIDLGTSGPKVAVVTVRGETVACESEPTRLLLLPGGGAEQDPADWWRAIVAAARRALERAAIPPESVVAVCCTGQWSGTVAVGADGRPLMNAVIWMDSRGAPYVRRVTGGWPSVEGYGALKLAEWIRLTGGIPGRSGKDPIAHILYLRHERPEVYRAARWFLEPKDYLNLKLTGRAAATFDSIALHWVTDNRDIDRVRYHPRLLVLSGLDRERLPDLVRATDLLGPLTREAARDLGLTEKAQVVAGTPDLHSAAIGSGAVRDGEAHLYLGTSSWLVAHVPFKKTDVLHNIASLPSALPGRYLVADEQECAGACLAWLRDQLVWPDDGLGAPRPEDAYPALDRVAAGAPAGAGKVLFAPWLNGERSPVDDRLVRGGFFNVSLSASRADLVRAVYEGVALNVRWLLGHVERFVGHRLEEIRAIGGGASSELWCQIHADVLDRTILQVARPVEANARGAALLAALALGRLRVEQIPERVEVARAFEPNPAHRGLYAEAFGELVGMYRATRKACARLNGPGRK